MGKVKSNVSYECRKDGAKGTLTENVESINLNEIKKLLCGCPAEKRTRAKIHSEGVRSC
jgi:hypothetical protein